MSRSVRALLVLSITLVASPFAHVTFKAQDLGVTPLFKTALPVGKHTLKLVGPDNKAYALPVEIREGQTANVRVNLADLQPE